MRNNAVDQCIWDHLKREDPLLQDTQKDKIIAGRKKHIDEADMPDFVSLHLPCIEFEPDGDKYETIKCDEITMKCMFTTQTVRTVQVECAADVLTYLRCAINVAAFEDSQRDSRKRSFSGVRGVRCDKRRKTVYVVVKTTETLSGTKRIQAKPDDWTEVFITQCARELLDRVTKDGEIIAYLGCDDGPSPEKPGDDGESPEKLAGGDVDTGPPDLSADGDCVESASAGP